MTWLLVLQVILFALWAVTVFRILFHLRKKGEHKTGQVWNGPFVFLSVARDWLSDPAEAKWRRDLFFLTALLFGVSIAFSLSAG